MRRTPLALLLVGLWVAALVLLGAFVGQRLVIGTDLRLYLPNPKTPQQRLLLEEIGEGPASRLLVIALSGAPAEELADASRALRESLVQDGHFRYLANGEVSLDSIPEDLLTYRYLLSPAIDERRFDAASLHSALQARARDLTSPAGAFLESWLPHDPTLELLEVLQRWQPMQEPRREFDVWFDEAGERALLVAETRAGAFDPDRQREAIEALQRGFERVRGSAHRLQEGAAEHAPDDPGRGTGMRAGTDGPLAQPRGDPTEGDRGGLESRQAMSMTVSGAGKFSVLMEARTRGEAQLLGTLATLGMILLLLLAYRRVDALVLSALPLASAGLTGLATVSALYGTVHGITLAFGFTLLGVAQDYPLHLLSHRRPDRTSVEIAHALWPALATGVVSTCIAYGTFLFAGVVGLAQLAWFTVAGLAVAGLTTRFALPPLMPGGPDYGRSAWLERLWARIDALPRLRWPGVALAIACLLVVLLAPQPMWDQDLSRLTPVPEELLREDQALRAQLGTPDVRYLLAVEAQSTQQALARLESLQTSLERLVERGVIGGYDHAARYLPSVERQRRRQAQLPEEAALRSAVQAAQAGTPFRPGVFEPFIEDVAAARKLPPLTLDTLRQSPLGSRLALLIREREGATSAFVTFSDVRDEQALQGYAAAAGPGVTLLDMKQASESLIAEQRVRMLWTLAIAAVLLAAAVALALRRRERVLRVLAPMILTTLFVLAALRATGVSLTLFHLIALMLAAGLGLDYALFFEHAARDRAEQRRTLHAVLLCSASTLMVFALLASSSLPVLRAIGVTVSLGVISNFLLALLFTRPASGDALPPSAST